MMQSFLEYIKQREWYGGSANNPSGTSYDADGGEAVEKQMEKPGAFPTYGDDLPITAKNRMNKIRKMKKDCNCGKDKK